MNTQNQGSILELEESRKPPRVMRVIDWLNKIKPLSQIRSLRSMQQELQDFLQGLKQITVEYSKYVCLTAERYRTLSTIQIWWTRYASCKKQIAPGSGLKHWLNRQSLAHICADYRRTIVLLLPHISNSSRNSLIGK
jgi:hypothetical protein